MQPLPRIQHSLAILAVSLAACAPSDFRDTKQRADADLPDAGESTDAAALPDAARVDGGLDRLDGSTRPDAQPSADAAPDARAASDGATDAANSDAASQDADVPDANPCGLTRRLAQPRVTELARLGKPGVFSSRTLGPSQRTNSSTGRAWVILSNQLSPGFLPPPGTPLNYPLIAFDGADEPWKASAALATPWRLREEGTDTTLPTAALQLRPDEPADSSFTPVSIISRPDELPGALAFVAGSIGFNATSKVWLADIDDARHVAMRRSTPLFEQPPFFMHAARRDGDFVYLYACSEPAEPFASSVCTAGRVHKDKVHDRSAYEVRTQRADSTWAWSANLEAGTAVLEGPFLQLSVTYNSYLRAYLAVFGRKFEDAIYMRTAETAYGPWSTEVVRVPLPKPPVEWHVYNVREHASIVQRCESRIMVTYSSPTALHESGLPSAAETVLVAVDLAE